uniref:TIGR04211 family SH3 domain-containing protein n=1 Tax=Ningiella ruwaisensis TaxID=2364274 RepID=UPI001444D211|nr:TIGR04211 family SH3 domain-containing protein [Ningiella ruwaisensis]
MKYLITGTVLVILYILSSTPTFAQTDTRYISDDLSVFIHSGPSREYRIIGSIESGTSVKLVSRSSDGQFVEIIDNENRQGWVEEQYIQSNRSQKLLLPELQQKLEETQAKIPPLEAQIAELETQVARQQQNNSQQSQDLEEAREKVEALETQLATKDLDMKIRWLINGGGLAVVCIILGILISYLPKKRKRNDGWA